MTAGVGKRRGEDDDEEEARRRREEVVARLVQSLRASLSHPVAE